MTFNETLYARDDEMDEFGDSGAYGDSLEEDYEEEEEEEEAEVAGVIEPQPEPVAPACGRAQTLRWEARPSRRASLRRKSLPRKSRLRKSPRRSQRRRSQRARLRRRR